MPSCSGRAEQFLRVFADDVAPQVEGVAPVPESDAGGLEFTSRNDVVHSAGSRDLRRVAPVQQKRRHGRIAAKSDRERGDGRDDGPAHRVERVTDQDLFDDEDPVGEEDR